MLSAAASNSKQISNISKQYLETTLINKFLIKRDGKGLRLIYILIYNIRTKMMLILNQFQQQTE